MNMNFDNIIDKVFDSCKKLTPALIALAGASGLLLFLPKFILKKMGLDKISPTFKSITGVVFIISAVLIFTIILWEICGTKYKQHRNKKIRKNLRERYVKLSPELKDILICMMKQPSKSMVLDITDGNGRVMRLYFNHNRCFLHLMTM